MIIRCAWCDNYVGEKPPYEDKSVTHSICPECRAKYFPDKRKKLADLEKEEYLANPPAYFMNKEHWSLDG